MEAFTQAEMTFLHQWVFCPIQKCLVNFHPLASGILPSDLPYIGECVEATVAAGVARGDLHPHSKEPLQIPNAGRRPMFPPSNRQTSIVTPDLKKNKSIQAFFKPQRTPLAELDPNSFNHSPGQEQLSRRASGPAMPATPLSEYITGTSLRTAMIPASAPLAARRTVSDNTITRANTDRATKRKRLCTDGSSPVSAKNAIHVESGKSKFFAQCKDPGTPSKRPTKSKKASPDFNLWSDDSIEEALLELPDPVSFTQIEDKPTAVFTNTQTTVQLEENAIAAVVVTEDISQETNVSIEASLFSQKRDQSTPPSSCESTPNDNEKSEPSPFEEHTLAEVKALRERFSYNAELKATARSAVTRTQSAPSLRKPLKAHTSHIPRPVASILELKSPKTRTEVPNSPIQEKVDDSCVLPEIDDTAWLEAESEIVVPASDTVEPPSPARPRQYRGLLIGSEDLLVSESDGDEVESPDRKPTLDLSRFAFAPR
jgi:exonuclease-1